MPHTMDELIAENARLREALKEYEISSNWSWTGECWAWQGPDSANYRGPKNYKGGYPEATRAECGSIAHAALSHPTNGLTQRG